jgi:hypothetical protein
MESVSSYQLLLTWSWAELAFTLKLSPPEKSCKVMLNSKRVAIIPHCDCTKIGLGFMQPGTRRCVALLKVLFQGVRNLLKMQRYEAHLAELICLFMLDLVNLFRNTTKLFLVNLFG